MFKLLAFRTYISPIFAFQFCVIVSVQTFSDFLMLFYVLILAISSCYILKQNTTVDGIHIFRSS